MPTLGIARTIVRCLSGHKANCGSLLSSAEHYELDYLIAFYLLEARFAEQVKIQVSWLGIIEVGHFEEPLSVVDTLSEWASEDTW